LAAQASLAAGDPATSDTAKSVKLVRDGLKAMGLSKRKISILTSPKNQPSVKRKPTAHVSPHDRLPVPLYHPYSSDARKAITPTRGQSSGPVRNQRKPSPAKTQAQKSPRNSTPLGGSGSKSKGKGKRKEVPTPGSAQKAPGVKKSRTPQGGKRVTQSGTGGSQSATGKGTRR
ncbi:hypothetical protein FRC04_009518, partial [Tulasnella sp. 424]